MNIQDLRKKIVELADITITCHPEPVQIEGNCSAINEEVDRQTAKWIHVELENGNQWAWCIIQVTATFAGLSASDWLCGCSYRSKEDFKQSRCFDDMIAAAITGLQNQILNMQNILEQLK